MKLKLKSHAFEGVVRLALLSVLALFLHGCASTSGVYSVGSDVYQVSATAITSFGGSGTARRDALAEANEFCLKQGKVVQVVDAKSDSQFTQGSSDVTFKCVSQTPAKQ